MPVNFRLVNANVISSLWTSANDASVGVENAGGKQEDLDGCL